MSGLSNSVGLHRNCRTRSLTVALFRTRLCPSFDTHHLTSPLLPPRRPKMRRLIRFIGFTDSNRAIALKQLTVAAATGNDVHGYFSSLTLLTYYPLVLLSGSRRSFPFSTLRQAD